MKFDVVVGNPPYQKEASGTSTSDDPIYNYFYDLANKVSDKYCLISPARFLFNAGKTPKDWNAKMLNDEHLKVIYYEQKSDKVFPNTDIKGGVSVIYRDCKKYFGKIGIYTNFEELKTILNKVILQNNFKSIQKIIYLQNKFDLTELYKDFPHYKKIIGSHGKEKRLTTPIFEQLDIFTDIQTSNNDIQIFGLIKNKRTYRWVNRKYLDIHKNLDEYKVFVPKSNGSGAIGEVLSTPLIGAPLIGFTFSFISFGNFDILEEAENCLKYIKTKFARTMLGILKITQDNLPEKWQYVPLQDFTSQSDIDWTQSISDIDRQLYKKYNLDETEIAFIEVKVQAMS